MPRNGRTTISRIQPAFPHPDTSWRRRMSANTMMNIQMNVNQKKNTSIDHSTVPNVQSAASIAATSYCRYRLSFRSPDTSAGRGTRLPGDALPKGPLVGCRSLLQLMASRIGRARQRPAVLRHPLRLVVDRSSSDGGDSERRGGVRERASGLGRRGPRRPAGPTRVWRTRVAASTLGKCVTDNKPQFCYIDEVQSFAT